MTKQSAVFDSQSPAVPVTPGPLQALFANFGHPVGLLGRVAGWIMAVENTESYRLVVDALSAQPDEPLLEIGCGPGVGLQMVATRVEGGAIVGVDASEVMVAQARRRCRGEIGRGRADVLCARAEALPFDDASFMGAFALNTLGHWDDLGSGLREAHRVLAPDGRLIVAFRGQRDASSRDPHARGRSEADVARLHGLLTAAGFAVARSDHELRRERLIVLRCLKPSVEARDGQ